jgi:ABC-2 type transport system ATP-binding protein
MSVFSVASESVTHDGRVGAATHGRDRMDPPRTGWGALACQGLTVRYGALTAVDDLWLDASPGEILGLLGPNGAGKTSVIRALTTIVPAAAGTAQVNGHDLSDPVGVRTSIGVLPESNGYPGTQTARAYLRYYGELFGMAPRQAAARAERQLELLGLADNDDPIRTFSRGMRQRLGLARAQINEPAVLFLDEPTLGLDPAGQEELLAHLVRAAAEDGRCVVVCSHLLDEVERVCDRVAIMHRARIVAVGTVDEVIAVSGVAGFCKLRLPLDAVAAAHHALRQAPGVRDIRLDNARPGDVEVELAAYDGAGTELLRRLLDLGIEPRSFDLQGARLSDAFLELTGPRAGVAR